MRNTLTRQLLAMMLIFLMLFTAINVVNIIGIFTYRRTVGHLIQRTLKEVDANGDFNTQLNRAVREMSTFIRTHSPDDRAQALEALRESGASLATIDQLNSPDGSLSLDDQQLRVTLQQRRTALLQQLRQHVDAALDASQTNDDAMISQALGRLESLEDDAQQLEESADALFEQDAATLSTLFNNDVRYHVSGIVVTLICFALLTGLTALLVRRRIIQPIRNLAQTADTIARGRLDQQISVTSRDEIGGLQRAFNTMISDLREQRAFIERRSHELEHSLAAQQQLFATVQQLSAPLLPLWEGVLLLPIVGHVDRQRAAALLETLLQGIGQRRARHVILDLTGLVALDEVTLHFLQRAVQAGRLLGAQVALAGVSAATAQAIVAEGIELGRVRTYRDLRSAVEAALPVRAADSAGAQLSGTLALAGS